MRFNLCVPTRKTFILKHKQFSPFIQFLRQQSLKRPLKKMGSGISSPLNENLNAIHNQLMRHAGADYDIATATTLTYSHFISYITELNTICANYKDKRGCVLVFAVKKGTDSNLFWKATVRIACVKLNTTNNQVESHRLLNIRQFLQVFRRISYECTELVTEGTSDIPPEDNNTTEGATANPPPSPLPPTVAASMILGETHLRDDRQEAQSSEHSVNGGKECMMATSLDECIICLERKPEVILPCCHAYCTPCIEQWWEYCQMPTNEVCLPQIFESVDINEKSCPVCRESLDSSEDTWILSEVPDEREVSDEIRKALISYATASTRTCQGPGTSSLQKQSSEMT